MKIHNQIDAIISRFVSTRDTVREREHHVAITESGREETFIEGDGEWRVMFHEHPLPEDGATECTLRFALVRGSARAACIGVEFAFKNWSTDNYVMMPADVFVRLWKRYGQFGQFVDLEKGTILIGGSASAGIAPGALALAAKLLNRPEYREVAVESANYYYANFVQRGITNGGPGEILQCPDSESSFGLLESFVELYECSGDRRWLRLAEDSAHIASSWTVSYDFIFPETSEFGKLDLHTTGSVWANAQNKHSAPGICTLSPVALLKLYRATENDAYLDLARDIAHNVTQYLSYAGRPIRAWDGRALPAGWMCERVNMSDWETKERIGGVFYGSCWCEASALFTYAELPGILFRTDSGKITVFDHVEAAVSETRTGWEISVKNPTAFAATVTLQMESGADFHKPLGAVPLAGCKLLSLNKGETKVLRVARTSHPNTAPSSATSAHHALAGSPRCSNTSVLSHPSISASLLKTGLQSATSINNDKSAGLPRTPFLAIIPGNPQKFLDLSVKKSHYHA